MTESYPLIQKLQKRIGQTNSMLRRLSAGTLSDAAQSRILPGQARQQARKYSHSAQKMRYVNRENLGGMQPERLELIGKQIQSRYQDASSLITLKPAQFTTGSFWGEVRPDHLQSIFPGKRAAPAIKRNAPGHPYSEIQYVPQARPNPGTVQAGNPQTPNPATGAGYPAQTKNISRACSNSIRPHKRHKTKPAAQVKIIFPGRGNLRYRGPTGDGRKPGAGAVPAGNNSGTENDPGTKRNTKKQTEIFTKSAFCPTFSQHRATETNRGCTPGFQSKTGQRSGN